MVEEAVCLRGGRVVDPARGVDGTGDVWLHRGLVAGGCPEGVPARVVDCAGLVVCPGLIETQAMLCEPGLSAKETIATGTAAAVAGGFTSVLAMPGNQPPVDDVNRIFWVQQRARESAVARVHVAGGISQGLAGQLLAPIGSMQQAGVVAVTDHPRCLQNGELMRRALEYAGMFDLLVMDCCRDETLSAGGVMNEGYWSTVLGLRGWPAIAEELMVARDSLLAELTGTRLHCLSLSTAGSLRILEEARQRGTPVTCSVTPHHLALEDENLQRFDSNWKVNPPLRTRRDREALKEGLRRGVVTVLTSDHQPHCAYEKEVEFDDAPSGAVGLEVALGVFLTELVHGGVLGLDRLVALLAGEPARLLGIPGGTLAPGAPGDVTVIDPDREWVVDPGTFQSKSHNTPFAGMKLKGRAVRTIVGGREAWNLEEGLKL